MTRKDGREPGELREIGFQRGFTDHAPGSVLVTFGGTRVLCTAVANDGVPPWLKGQGRGWLTAEYSMLPSSTLGRKPRDRSGKIDGRSVEIQRLVGRAVRGVVDFKKMTERTVWVDCDVLQADGGTRTAAISGAWVALHDLFTQMDEKRQLRDWPLAAQLGAVSVGIVDGTPMCDLCYEEDSLAGVDMNVVMGASGEFVEVQATGEKGTLPRKDMDRLLDLAEKGCRELLDLQARALAEA